MEFGKIVICDVILISAPKIFLLTNKKSMIIKITLNFPLTIFFTKWLVQDVLKTCLRRILHNWKVTRLRRIQEVFKTCWRFVYFHGKEECEKIWVFKPLYQWYNKIEVLGQQIKWFNNNNEKLELVSLYFVVTLLLSCFSVLKFCPDPESKTFF